MGVRYYDPITGRFLSRDPIPSGVNLYSYADGNPIRYIDPTGMRATGTWAGDTGQVFLGYWDTVNPVNAYHSAKALYQVAKKTGVRNAGKVLWKGTKEGFTKWTYADDPREFGQSFGNVLVTAAALAAPYAKAGSAGAAGEVAGSAAKVESSTGAAIKSLPSAVGEGSYILGRRLMAHAAKSMMERNVTVGMVEKALTKGTRYWSPKHNSVVHIVPMASGKFLEVGVQAGKLGGYPVITHVFPYLKAIPKAYRALP